MNKRRKLIASLMLLMICGLILSSEVSCKSPSEIKQNMRQRTVQLVFAVQQKQGDTTAGLTPVGTGILVNNDGYVITADHLLDSGEQYMQQSQAAVKKMGIVVLAPPGVSGSSSVSQPLAEINDFDVIARDSKHDLALLKIKMLSVISPMNGKTLLTVNFNRGVGGSLNVGDAHFYTRIAQNDAVAITGYTSDVVTGAISYELMPETRTGNVTSKEMTSISSSNLSAATGSITYSISDYYQTDITSNPVLSGSPVYFPKNGDIVGMGISILDPAGQTVIVPGKYVLDLLKSNSVDLK
jgi:S1-C subfamily serine protease